MELVVGYLPTTSGSAKYSSYDYLGDDKPNASTTKLNPSSDVVWFYITDSTTDEPVPAGLTFRLSGATDSGETFERTATTDSYGYLCFGTVPFGSYYVQCISDTAAGETYFVEDSAVTVLNVANGKLVIDNAMQAHTVAADSLLTLEVTIKWSGEEISAGETYTKERPKSLYLELHSGSTAYAQRYVSPLNTSLIFSTEIIITMLMSPVLALLFGTQPERITALRLAGAGVMVLGILLADPSVTGALKRRLRHEEH